MRQLRSWADLSYRQLERRASDVGDALPRATVSGVLAREELPREELLTAFVRACGGDAATIGTWLDARRRLAMDTEPSVPDWGAGEPRPDFEPDPEPGKVAESSVSRAPGDGQPDTGSVAEIPGPDSTEKGSADSPVRPPHPFADDTADTAVTAAGSETAGRRGRRPALIAVLSVVVLVPVLGVMGIALLPDDAGQSPRVTPGPTTTVTRSPSAAPSGAAKPVTAPPPERPDTARTQSPKTSAPPAEDDPRPSSEPPSSGPAAPPDDPPQWQQPSPTPSSLPDSTGNPEDCMWHGTAYWSRCDVAVGGDV